MTGVSITAITAIADINVANGTALDAIGLPATATISKSDGTSADVAVTWDGGTPAYDAATAGTYSFSGTIAVPEGVTNPNNLKAAVNVNVAEAAGLNVQSVSVITMTGVTVSFPALTEAKADATVTVVNDKGVAVPVTAKLLDVGETTATFNFVTALTAEPVGTWTVNGISFDANAQAAIKAVNDAADQVKLLAALKSSYFKNVNDDKIVDYWTAMNAATYTTVAEVQKAIDDANASITEAAAVKAVVDAADATPINEVTLLNALQDSHFTRVNADWIHDYATYDSGAGVDIVALTPASTVANVQTIIDAVNNIKVTAAIAAVTGLDTAKLATARTLVSLYVPNTTPAEKTAYAAKVKALDIADAVIKVNDAQTKASLSSALTNLATLDSANLDKTKINSILMGEYLTAIKAQRDLAATNVDTTTEIAGILYAATTGVNDVQLAAAVNAITTDFATYTAADAADQAAALTQLQRLSDVTTAFDKATIVEALLADYITDISTDVAKAAAGTGGSAGPAIDWTTATDAAKVVAIQNLVNDANAAVVGDALDAIDLEAKTPSDATGAALLALLKDSDLNLTNVVDANALAYLTDKALIDGAITDTTSVPATDLPKLVKVVTTINYVADANAAITADAMNTALTGIAVNESTTAYVNLSSAAKLEVAQLVLAARDADPSKQFADLAAVKTALTGKTTAYTTDLAAVNAATDIDGMKTALDKTTFPAFQALDGVAKVQKAELVLNKLAELQAQTPASSFKTIAEINAAAGL